MSRWEVLGMAPYHQSAGAVLSIGIFTAFAFALIDPWWMPVGFFVGAIPALLILAVHHAREEAEWDAAHQNKDEG